MVPHLLDVVVIEDMVHQSLQDGELRANSLSLHHEVHELLSKDLVNILLLLKQEEQSVELLRALFDKLQLQVLDQNAVFNALLTFLNVVFWGDLLTFIALKVLLEALSLQRLRSIVLLGESHGVEVSLEGIELGLVRQYVLVVHKVQGLLVLLHFD